VLRATHKVVNIDISAECIAYQHEQYPDSDYVIADATDLANRGVDAFDLVVDKGTFDAALAAGDSVCHKAAQQLAESVLLLLRPGAKVAIFSIVDPARQKTLITASFDGAAASIGLAPPLISVEEIPIVPLERPDQKCLWLYTVLSSSLASSDSACVGDLRHSGERLNGSLIM
jgi:SAM-dependent methyltransferase